MPDGPAKNPALLKITEYAWDVDGSTRYRCPCKVAAGKHKGEQCTFSSHLKDKVKAHMWDAHFAAVQAHIAAQREALRPTVPLYDGDGRLIEQMPTSETPPDPAELEAIFEEMTKETE